jgi:hypothetical protein
MLNRTIISVMTGLVILPAASGTMAQAETARDSALQRQFPNMKFAPGKRQCLNHLLPYLRHLQQQETRFNTRAQRLGIAGTTRWRNAAIHWRKRRHIWTRASYCWPCFDKSDLEREWRAAPVDLGSARKALAAANTALQALKPGSAKFMHSDLTRAYAAAEMDHARARRKFYGCLLNKGPTGG